MTGNDDQDWWTQIQQYFCSNKKQYSWQWKQYFYKEEDKWTQCKQYFYKEQDRWAQWKQNLDLNYNSLDDINRLADSIVQDFWRPILGGILVMAPAFYIFSKYMVGKRFKTAAHIPQEAFEKSLTIRGKVVAVGDSDNFRLYHTPGIGWGWIRQVPKSKKELQNQTIAIRIAGVDAPESAHFGMPAQPFSAEAKEYLTKMVLNKKAQVHLLSRDQYSRVVAMAYVRTPPLFMKKNVSLEMIKQGLASLYVAKGAQYDGMLDELKKHEEKAKKSRKGIWSLKNYVSPGDHKAKFL